jgi:hypothetical protein
MSETLTPEAVNVVNTFDYIGLLLGLPRLPAEDNPTYRKRLWDVYVHLANSTEQGLINGITRELGLDRFDAIKISSSSSDSPRVIIKDTTIELYSNWSVDDYGNTSSTLEATIDIYSKDSDAYFLPGLISAINATTSFSAIAVDTVDTDTLSATLIPTDSRIWVDSETIYPVKRQKLDYTPIIPGTVRFTFGGQDIFTTEQDSEGAVTSAGDYYIDYTNGYLISYSIPKRTTSVRYMYDQLPITVEGSPVILHEFGSEDFLDKNFEQIQQPDGTYIDGLPDADMVDTIQELFAAAPTLWGE